MCIIAIILLLLLYDPVHSIINDHYECLPTNCQDSSVPVTSMVICRRRATQIARDGSDYCVVIVVLYMYVYTYNSWLVVSTPLKNISQLG